MKVAKGSGVFFRRRYVRFAERNCCQKKTPDPPNPLFPPKNPLPALRGRPLPEGEVTMREPTQDREAIRDFESPFKITPYRATPAPTPHFFQSQREPFQIVESSKGLALRPS